MATSNSENNEFISPAEAMKRLGYASRASFWAMVHRNGPPITRISARRILFPRADFERWLESRTSGRAA